MNAFLAFLASLRIARTSPGPLPAWALSLALFLPAVGQGQTLVDIANSPLYGGNQPHPNVVVSASVEFPTVGTAFRNVPVYVRTDTYLGYFDPTRCYVYTSSGGSGNYFVPANSNPGTADSNHECATGNTFSGNFMNWATMSGIDEVRYALTGGNRVVDPASTSGAIIERAYLPDGSIGGVPDFYNSGNFPAHTLVNGTIDGNNASTLRAVLPNSIGSNSDTVYVYNCRTQVYFSKNSAGGNCGSPAGTAYDVRVQVCDANEGPGRPDLCLNYGSTTSPIYKPVGESQRNADRMRFSVFGYLMDRAAPSGCDGDSGWNRCRYGGVMRSSMKYLGPKKYDANLAATGNANAEINADGTFTVNPDANKTSDGTYSGFINYLNKFGQTGIYKRHDPVGEIYYEALRYFQGPPAWTGSNGPTPDAVSNITLPMLDKFPVVTTWTDPIVTQCSANYIISIGDTNNSNDLYLPGFNGLPNSPMRPGARPAVGGLDVEVWTQRIADLESAGFKSLSSGDTQPSLSDLATRRTGNDNTAGFYAAGAAFWANTQDIRPELTGKQTVKTISVDVGEVSGQPVQQREIYLMGKYGGFNNTIDRASDSYADPFFASDPSSTSAPAIRSNVEWESSPGSGSPANYLFASDPQKLITGLRAAFANIADASGTLSGASLTSANLTVGGADAYIAKFDPKKWSGAVQRVALSVDATTGLLVVSSSPLFDSALLLDARCGTAVTTASLTCTDLSVAPGARKIITVGQSLFGTRVATNFSLLGLATSTAYLAALATDPASGVLDLEAQQRINYIRGFRGDEVSALGYRSRASAMGDIINSGPVYVGAPSTAIPDADYLTFYTANKDRSPAVYVGANDGMLHALDALTGAELFAYIPGYSYANLNDLTNPAYSHKTFVDTVPKVQEVNLNGTWKTVLLGANGNGAQGIFGLDVSDPSTFGTSKVLFEFSDADDADFGNVMAVPEIAKLRVGPATGNGVPVYRYFAVVTGYNNRRTAVNGHVGGDTNVSTDTLNKGVLFLIALDHTLGAAWVRNTDYYKFTFPATSTTAANGLGPVTLLPSRSGDRSTAAMYFGDLQGNFWRFNTTGNDPSAWIPARGTLAAPLPIFVATDASNNRQPITARPEIAAGPFGSTLVFFGTGEYLGQSDLVTGVQQSEYTLLDTGSSSIISRSADLVQRTASLSGGNVTITGSAFTYSGPSAKKGWYVDFPGTSTGERSVTKPAIRTGLLTFTTLTLSADICGAGSGFIYQVNALTGLPFGTANVGGYASTVGIPGPPRIVDLTLSGGAVRATGEQINNKTQATLVSGTLGKIDTPGQVIPTKTPPVGRINWREITNWNDLVDH